jgi:uncharacterized protein (TIGR03437 family)
MFELLEPGALYATPRVCAIAVIASGAPKLARSRLNFAPRDVLVRQRALAAVRRAVAARFSTCLVPRWYTLPPVVSLVDGAAGLYSATWTPRNTSSQVTIAATAVAPGFVAATAQIARQVKPNAAPVISPNAVLHIFDPQIGGALAPGTVVQIYGDSLAAQPGQPPTIPLPNSFGGTSVLIGGIESPLFYVAPGQINAQVPFELAAGRQYQVIINANGALSTPVPIQLDPVSPRRCWLLSGQIIAQHPDYSLVLDTSPAKPGEIIVLYVAGMGKTDNPAVTSGSGSPGLLPGDKFAHPLIDPALTLDGVPMKINFSGLTPGAVGLYQVNFQVPLDATDGNHEVVLSQSGATGNKTLLPVHK